MKIYNSTEYIKKPSIGDLQLKVNSMWDFKSRNVCFQTIDSTFGGGKTTISYDLQVCVNVEDSFVIGSEPPKPCKNTRWEQAQITPEIVTGLIEKGYTVSKDFMTDLYKCQSYTDDEGKIINCSCGECNKPN